MLPCKTSTNSIMIVAHLDDDVIWMLPFIDECSKVYVAAVPLTYGHVNIMAEYSKWFPNTQWYPVRGMMETGPYCDNFLNREAGPLAEAGGLIPGDYIFESGTYILAGDGFIYVRGERAAKVDLTTGKCYDLGGDFIGTMSGENSGTVYFTHIPGGGSVVTGRSYKKQTNEVILTTLLRDIIADPEVTTIYTHNPWGEYGHEQHRMVSNVVRKLAVQYNKEVWIPNIVVRDAGGYLVYTAGNITDIESKYGYFDDNLYKQIKQIYLDETTKASMMPWYSGNYALSYWTWGDDYPKGNQQYLKAVSDGVDWTDGDYEIKQLVQDIPVF